MWGEFSVAIPPEDGNQRQNNNLADFNQPQKVILNSQSPIHLSYEGTLYCWGDDTENKFGVLGLGNQYKAQRPCPNSQLFDYMIKNVSLAETHSCAVDSSGRLFCWGFGPNGELGLENQVQQVNIPTIVTKQKQMTIKKAIAHSTYTVFCSSAGYVFLYGTLHQSLNRMQFASIDKFNSQKIKGPFLQSQDRQVKDSFQKQYQQQQSQNSSKPMNGKIYELINRQIVMTQILSLSENFISDMICGDTFILCLTSIGDLFFVDDALESVQINIQPILSAAIAGSKILGISQGDILYEWSTAGLNKLSFNKENKMLLRQDFNIREYKLEGGFLENPKLFNLPIIKQQVGILYQSSKEEMQSIINNFKEREDLQTDSQIIIAKLLIKQKHPHFGQLDDSSLNESQENIEQALDTDQQNLNDQPKLSPDSFKKSNQTPEISISVNEFKGKHDHQPSFRVIDQTMENQFSNPSQFINTRELNNIFNLNSDNVTVRNKNYFCDNLDSPSLLEDKVDQKSETLRNLEGINFSNEMRPVQQNNLDNFFTDGLQINTENMFINQNNQGFPYRPSSIKSFGQSNDKSKGYLLFNNNSSPSMKQCTEQLQNQIQNNNFLGESQKLELSYPSFLNTSQDLQQNLDEQNKIQVQDDENYNLQNQSHANLNNKDEEEEEKKNSQDFQNNELYTSINQIQIENLDSSFTPVQISIQQPFIEQFQDQIEDNENYDEQRVEYQIRFNPSYPTDSMNLSQSKNSSKEASIVRKTKKVDDGIEESMEITIDNIMIKTKRTTTPKRILNAYNQGRRLQSTNSQLANAQKNDNSQSNIQSNTSPISHHSELSDEFDISQNSGSQIDRLSYIQQQHQKLQDNIIDFNQSSLKNKQQKLQNHLYSNGHSNSSDQQKNQSLIEAMKNRIANQRKISIENTKQTSVTQIYEISPLKDDSQIVSNNNLPNKQNEQSQNQERSQQQFLDNQNINHNFQIINNFPQILSQSQFLPPLQQRYSNLVNQNLQYQIPGRESVAKMTNQTEDNFEIEYTISQSQTPDSHQQAESNIKRRINFDETSCLDNNGCVIRVSDVNSVTNRLINSFTLNLNQPSKIPDKKDISNIILQRANNQQQTLQNNPDQSQSFIFNQSTTSIPQVQPFNDENLVSNIKSASTPSHNGNSTHFMMLTEEKFKNLRSEISLQQDIISNQPSYQINLNNLNPSPRVIDFTSTVKPDSQNQMRPSNINNISSFIQHSKYFQVYENFRRGFQLLASQKDSLKSQAFNLIKLYSSLKLQKEQRMQRFVKQIQLIVKQNTLNKKLFGFKRIKKHFKEQQLRIYIQQKQKQFAKQAQAIVRVDAILKSHIFSNIYQTFKGIQRYSNEKQIEKVQKQSQSLHKIIEIVQQKERQSVQQKFLKLFSYAIKQKLAEINALKIAQNLEYLFINKQRDFFEELRRYFQLKKILGSIFLKNSAKNLQQSFDSLRQKINQSILIRQKYTKSIEKISSISSKCSLRYAILQWKTKIQVLKKAVIALEMISHIHEQQQKYKHFKKFKQSVQDIKLRQNYLKSMKASLLLLFKKLEEIRKKNIKTGLIMIASNLYEQNETMLVKQSSAYTNLSFTLQQPVEMSLILNKRVNEAQRNALNKTVQRDIGDLTNRNHYRTQQQPYKNCGRQNLKGSARVNYQTNLNNQTYLATVDKKNKPTLNDYLSFTPNTDSQQKQTNNNSKFFNHQRNDAGFSSAKNQNKTLGLTAFTKIEKQYLDCPLPYKDYQEKQSKKSSRQDFIKNLYPGNSFSNHQQSYENMNQLNLSIKDMNKAFRDQISRLKERQDEQDKSYMSSVNNHYGYDQSFDLKINQLQIEITQTPDQFHDESQEIQKKKLIFENQSKNISPKINPLCISESYQIKKRFLPYQQGFNLYSIENNENLQGQMNSLRNQNDGAQSYIVDQNSASYYNKPIVLSNQINEHLNLNHNDIPQTSTFGELRIPVDENDINDEDVNDGNQEHKFDSINQTESRSSNLQSSELQRHPSEPISNLALTSHITKKRSDQRYQLQSELDQDFSVDMDGQQLDIFDDDLCQDENQNQNLIHRVQSSNNISSSYVKNSIAEISKKRDTHYSNSQNKFNNFNALNSQSQLQGQNSEYFLPIQQTNMQIRTHDYRQNNDMQNQYNPNHIQYAFQMYQEQQNKKKQLSDQKSMDNLTKNLHISPKFTNYDESFVPSQLNRDLLNEMAANYQMLELTPDGDYQMLVQNKSIFQREESSVYSNQYAEPMEMALSPRNNIEVSIINPQNLTTNQSQLNCYGMNIQDQLDYNQNDQDGNEYDNEYQDGLIDDNILSGRESRPYDFELSSNSKYKIISENQFAQQVLTTEQSKPSAMMPAQNQNICKKLSFGYDLSKRNSDKEKQKQKKSTLIVSGGEQTINFNLTQEDDENQQMQKIDEESHHQYLNGYNQGLQQDQDEEEGADQSDEELDVGEEIPAEQAQKIMQIMPESRILQQELQEEKFNMTYQSQADFFQITQGRGANSLLETQTSQHAQTHRQYQAQSKRGQFNTQDFIQSNIQKLRNILKVSPRYQQIETTQSDDFNSKVNSVNQSTRNANSNGNMLFSFKPQMQTYDINQRNQKREALYPQLNNNQEEQTRFSQNNKFQNDISEQVTQRIIQESNKRAHIFNQTTSFASQNNQRAANQNRQKQYLTNSRGTSKENKSSSILYSNQQMQQNQQQINVAQTNFNGGFVNILDNRKQSIPISHHQQQQLSHQNSQQSLNQKKAATSRKSGSGGYQPMTFRAPLQTANNPQQQNSSQSGDNSYLKQPTQYYSQSNKINYDNINQMNNSQLSLEAQNRLNATGGSNQNSSSITNNNSKILNSTGSQNAFSGIGVRGSGSTGSAQVNGFELQQRKISHQDILINIDSNRKNRAVGNVQGFGTTSQRASQNSLNARSRNNQQPEKVQTFISMGNKVMQNATQLNQNQQNSFLNNTGQNKSNLTSYYRNSYQH